MLVTFESYRDITGDRLTDEALVTARCEEAQGLLEEATHRYLEEDDRIETLPMDRYGLVYPHAYPVTALTSTGSIFDDVSIRGVQPDDLADWSVWNPDPPVATIAYTGGYTAVTAPRKLLRAIAQLAQALSVLNPLPQGATSASVGDVAVTFARATEGLGALVPGLDTYVKRLRYRGRIAA